MPTYHAAKPGTHIGHGGSPLCGQRGTMMGFHTTTVAPAEWNALRIEWRCKKCIAKIQARKAAKS